MKAVIFDFDYTLGDSTEGIVLSVDHALKRMGHSERDAAEIKRTIGLSLRDTYAVLTKSTALDEAEQFAGFFKEKADEVMVLNTELYPDAKEVLQGLKAKGYRIGIVTTKYHSRIEQILDKFDAAGLVDRIVGGDDVRIEKPDPEGLLWLIRQWNLEKGEVLYVGDSLVDARTAQNAGVPFAAVLTGTTSGTDFEAYDHVYIGEDLKDIYTFIQGR